MDYKDIISFQGGGQYDDRGQLIHAKLVEDGAIAFLDVSRNIDGIIPSAVNRYIGDKQESAVQETTMWHYLRNSYTWRGEFGSLTWQAIEALKAHALAYKD
jgi:hypothetical protein